MGETIETLRQKMSPGELLDQALEYFKRSGPSRFPSNVGETITNNPVPVTLIGLCIGWLLWVGSRDGQPSQTWTTTSHAQDCMGAAASGAAATGQAEQEGVSRQSVDQRRHEAGAKGARVAQAAGHAAQEEAQKSEATPQPR
jgi:hypothetical protein